MNLMLVLATLVFGWMLWYFHRNAEDSAAAGVWKHEAADETGTAVTSGVKARELQNEDEFFNTFAEAGLS